MPAYLHVVTVGDRLEAETSVVELLHKRPCRATNHATLASRHSVSLLCVTLGARAVGKVDINQMIFSINEKGLAA